MPGDVPYPIIEVRPEWVLESEVLGSKEKFWYKRSKTALEWLFKFPKVNTGEHWAEKIAAEIAAQVNITHARVELAVFNGVRGSAGKSFVERRRNLFHGNQILAGQVFGYDPQAKYGQCDHTLANIFRAIDGMFPTQREARQAKVRFAEYATLDALIGNTDRHHENWGIMLSRRAGRVRVVLAPTFDHAASLGRELRDDSARKCRKRLLTEHRVGIYSESAHGGIYWTAADRRGISPLALVRRAVACHPGIFRRALAKVRSLDRHDLDVIIHRIPADWMTDLEREFAKQLLSYNLDQLLKISL